MGDGSDEAMIRFENSCEGEVDFSSCYMLSLCSFTGKANILDEQLENFLLNSVQEIVFGQDNLGYLFCSRRDTIQLWIVMPANKDDRYDYELGCLIEFFSRTLPDNPANIYYARPAKCKELPRLRAELEQMDANNVVHIGAVLCFSGPSVNSAVKTEVQLPTALWIKELKEGKRAELFNQIRDYICELQYSKQISRAVLNQFHKDYLQLVYSALEQENIQGHLLFQDEAAQELYDVADRSVFDMMKWVGFSIGRACEAILETQNMKTELDRVREYIDERFCEKIVRSDIANHFFISEDHLSHLFNKGFGTSIPDYVNRKRIEYATELLRKGHNISDVSIECGFDSSSYFSTVFKSIMGCTPSDYRKRLTEN